MQHLLAKHSFIITGAASGIGLATARLLQEAGAQLALWDSNAESLDQVGKALGAQTTVVDVTCEDQVQDAVSRAAARFGAIHGVVHAAGILRTGRFEQIPMTTHRRMVEVNLIGTLLVTHATLPALIATRG